MHIQFGRIQLGQIVLALLFALASVMGLAKEESAKAFTIYTTKFPRLVEPEGTAFSGLYVELMRKVEGLTGYQFKWVIEPWPRAQMSALTDPEGLIANFTRTPEREPKYRWIGVMGRGQQGIFVLKENPANHLDDLKNQLVGYLNGSDLRDTLVAKGFKQLDPGNTGESNAKKLHFGRIAGWTINVWQAESVYEQAGFSFDELRVFLLAEPWDQWLAASPQFPPAAATQIETALRQLKANGTVKTLETKYWRPIQGLSKAP